MPSPIISDINPNSLGALQPIRGVGVQPSIPTPLNITPYIQGQSVVQNNRRLGLAEEQFSLEKKQFEFNQGLVISKQIDELIGANNQGVNSFINEQKQRKGDFSETFGLDPNYSKHNEILSKYSAELNSIQNGASKSLNELMKIGNPKMSDINQLKLETGAAMSKFKQRLALDPEYSKYTRAEKSFNEFNNRIQTLQEKGLVVDQAKYNQIAKAYENFANGSDRIEDKILLGNLTNPKFFDNVVFSKVKADESVKQALTDIFKPIEVEAPEIIPNTNGIVAPVKRSIVISEEEALPSVYQSLISNKDVVQMVEAASGYTIDTEQGKSAFDQFVKAQVSQYSRPKGYENIITDINANKILKNPDQLALEQRKLDLDERKIDVSEKEKSEGSNLTQGEREDLQKVNSAKKTLLDEGYDPSGVDNIKLRDIYDIGLKKPQELHKEIITNKDGTKSLEIWRVKLDSDGNRVEEIINTDSEFNILDDQNPEDLKEGIESGKYKFLTKPVKVDRLVTLPERNYTISSGNGDVGYRNNNPQNLRGSDGNFKDYNSLEEGYKDGYNDNLVKIEGRSPAMKSSKYMVDKYGKDKLDNYQEFATVEDLINVRTPRAKNGGDNSDAAVDGMLSNIETFGIKRDTKLSDLNGEQIDLLNQAIVKTESPDSYNALFNKNPIVKKKEVEKRSASTWLD